MRSIILFILLACSFPTLALDVAPQREISTRINPREPNTIVKEYSSLQDTTAAQTLFSRTIDYPTQIVRIAGEIKQTGLSCEQVLQTISSFFTKKITADKFFYNTLVSCVYDRSTEFAKRFSINSYFDPLTNDAIDYLKNYLAQHQGKDLLGTPFQVESAKGVIVSLNIDAGVEYEQDRNVLLRYRHDNASHYFASNYILIRDLVSDIRTRFFSNDRTLILPFIDQWFSSPGSYEDVLAHSNYVELQPERIFLMNKEPIIFTSHLRHYFAHHCSRYPNRYCL